ncbi:MAG: SpoIIE family protein phosphatase [Planctomycetes bacterium]|nr:SpoIIE family protein phosphatase [Planctomycetota bacterium]
MTSREIRSGDDLVIGRDSGCDIVIPDRSVSRRHCRVKLSGHTVEFSDMGSANGLFAHGQLAQRVLLNDGEVVSLGTARIIVQRTTNQTGMIPITGLFETVSPSSDPEFGADVSSWGESSSSAGPSSVSDSIVRDPSESSISSSQLATNKREYQKLERERMALLIETGKSLAQSADLEELLDRIVDHLFQALAVRRAVIALTEDGTEFVARKVMPSKETEELSSIASQSIMRRVAAQGCGEIINDAVNDQKLNSNMSIVISNIRAAICTPILFNNRCLGAIYADYPGRARLYTPADLDFLTAFASIAAVSLENARMVNQLRKQERINRDLEVAAEIQKGLLPNEVQEFEGVEIDWAYWPSLTVGGDFFDVIELDDGRIAALLGDVSGKSVPAALYMARTLSILRATISSAGSPGEAMTRTNNLLGETEGRVLFATTFLMILSPDRRRIEWTSAGHNPVLIRDLANGLIRRLDAESPPLGVVPGIEYETYVTEVDPGAFISIYTDGMPEARDRGGVEFGIPKVESLIHDHHGGPASDATKAMISSIQKHIIDSPYIRDDVCILNLRIL